MVDGIIEEKYTNRSGLLSRLFAWSPEEDVGERHIQMAPIDSGMWEEFQNTYHDMVEEDEESKVVISVPGKGKTIEKEVESEVVAKEVESEVVKKESEESEGGSGSEEESEKEEESGSEEESEEGSRFGIHSENRRQQPVRAHPARDEVHRERAGVHREVPAGPAVLRLRGVVQHHASLLHRRRSAPRRVSLP